jgi:hypothetical protein
MKVKKYITHGRNIIITGQHGVGKTAVVRESASALKLKTKYYSVATLDPFTDLVGIPVPDAATKTVEYYRPRDIDEAEVIIFDEANRGDARTRNAIMEIVQFGTINGDKLPNLKCVVAMVNPNDGVYDVEDIDPALLDRFDVYLHMEAEIDFAYFKRVFGEALAKEAQSVWKSYHTSYTTSLTAANPLTYISPRRMEKILQAYVAMPTKTTLEDTLPPGAVVGTAHWHTRFQEALNPAPAEETPLSGATSAAVKDFTYQNIAASRTQASADFVTKHLSSGTFSDAEKAQVLNHVALVLENGVGAPRMAKVWGYCIAFMSERQIGTLMANWSVTKRRELREGMQALSYNTSHLLG